MGNTIKCKFTTVYRHSAGEWERGNERVDPGLPFLCQHHFNAHATVLMKWHRLHLTHMQHCFSKITKWQRFAFFSRLLAFFAFVVCYFVFFSLFSLFSVFIFLFLLCFIHVPALHPHTHIYGQSSWIVCCC